MHPLPVPFTLSEIYLLDTDINECMEGQHDCHQRANAVCSNMIGSYTCNCQTGYQLEGRICRGKAVSLALLFRYTCMIPGADQITS
jgi:hypothetical protein